MNNFGAEVWKLIVGLVKHAYNAMPGATGKEKKEAVIKWACQMINTGEELLPIAKWANIPAVDGCEHFLVGLAVEWAWTQLQLPTGEQNPVAHSPEVQPKMA